jgi:transposase
VETEPRAIIKFLRGEGRRYRRIGIEAMSFTPWLYEALAKAGLPIICIDAWRARQVLKTRLNKTDRNDARGIAQLMWSRSYRAVHVKTHESQEAKLFLTARRHLTTKRKDIDNLIRATLLQAGRKIDRGRPASFDRRVLEALPRSAAFKNVAESLLSVRRQLNLTVQVLEAEIIRRANDDEVCRRFLQVPGVGPLTALSFKAAVDVPERFARSRDVGVHLGLTPRAFRSGRIDRKGRISRCGDEQARTALFMAARSLMQRHTHTNPLKEWGERVVAARGYMKGLVAVARKLAVILHRMWLDGSDFVAVR